MNPAKKERKSIAEDSEILFDSGTDDWQGVGSIF